MAEISANVTHDTQAAVDPARRPTATTSRFRYGLAEVCWHATVRFAWEIR